MLSSLTYPESVAYADKVKRANGHRVVVCHHLHCINYKKFQLADTTVLPFVLIIKLTLNLFPTLINASLPLLDCPFWLSKICSTIFRLL